jgi:hypothetical protein
MSFPRHAHTPTSVALSAVFLWLTGVGCLLACGVNEVLAESIRASELRALPSCCAGTSCVDEERPQPIETDGRTYRSSDDPRSCSLLAGYGVGDTPRLTALRLELADRVAGPALEQAPATHEAQYERAVRLADKGGTYLRCCVFLI